MTKFNCALGDDDTLKFRAVDEMEVGLFRMTEHGVSTEVCLSPDDMLSLADILYDVAYDYMHDYSEEPFDD